MKHCEYCGMSLDDEAVFCPHCGGPCPEQKKEAAPEQKLNVFCISAFDHAQTPTKPSASSALREVAHAFMIYCSFLMAFALVPLTWCVPMCYAHRSAINAGRKASFMFSLLTFILVSRVAGVLMLIDLYSNK